ncbi:MULTISPECIES: HEAT repeat domain-containing protein [unclassified Kitasatospora]|uniref:HEAT repeat domain-containing protein n=1 Tax=unclassified Kitasatospora TaxID=2633591 RepID=UPI0012FCA59B|nr:MULTISPECIES: HEAT repeat domain-containing protein [unclassified Kitasatospora]
MDTVAELVGRALATAGVAAEAGDWGEYRALLWQAAADGPTALLVGLELILSGEPAERRTGCDLLGDAADQNEEIRTETATALVALAERETAVEVLRSLVHAVERTYDQRAVPVLVGFAGHPDAEVRREVACSFAGLVTGRPDGPEIRALITLTRDEEPEVRNWATFTLGFQAEVDSPEIRAALWERVSDGYPDAREEGIRGLARRRDPRAVPLLTELLDDPEGALTLTFDAAQLMGAPELLPALLTYDPAGPGVAAAVRACDPVQQAQLESHYWELLSTLDRLRPDVGVAVLAGRFEEGLTLDVGSSSYDVEALIARAGGDPLRAVDLVLADLA